MPGGDCKFLNGQLASKIEKTGWMALSAQAVAAKAAPKTILNPPPFAELFRRSKFASYDAAIRQTYQAPPANSHRGDWGVKRPLSLRRKNAFISLTSFEHHAHFTEWNHAEKQVRFIRRIEEMGGKAVMDHSTAWYRSLGSARTAPSFDSDFCPGEKWEYSELLAQPETAQLETAQLETVQPGDAQLETVQPGDAQLETAQPGDAQPETVNLDTLGRRGPGAYGSQREESPIDEPLQEVSVTPNIRAMSKREFDRYVRSLRAQRSDFKEFVNAQEAIEEKNLYALAVHADDRCYRTFLQSQMQKEFADHGSQKIEPRPHPNGALLYTRPTALESSLWTRSKPGFYLHDLPNPVSSSTEVLRHIVSFGGILSRVNGSVVPGKQMLLAKETDKGVEQENIEDSVVQLRLNPFNPIMITSLPRTVGNKPQGLKAVKVNLTLAKGDFDQMVFGNPHPPGSKEYVAMYDPSDKRQPLKNFNSLKGVKGNFSGERSKDTERLLKTLHQSLKIGNVGDRDL
ncbi:hypothetical protein C0992_003006 [Termitomyces sp. T32_za158]|nr:hypothetical protein C0992_003006 [Termitomyces sp. T32_za158]